MHNLYLNHVIAQDAYKNIRVLCSAYKEILTFSAEILRKY